MSSLQLAKNIIAHLNGQVDTDIAVINTNVDMHATNK